MKRRLFLFLILLITMLHAVAQDGYREQSLGSGAPNVAWSFESLDGAHAQQATVPGNVYTDLLLSQQIEDPFVADNAAKLHWVDTTTWIYTCHFTVDSLLLKKQHQAIVFEGLDTYCEVYLNDHLVHICDNMFRSYSFDLSAALLPRENTLSIKFYPAETIARKRQQYFEKANQYALPEGERVFLRKAQYQFGWDFAPRLLGVGVWRPVYLQAWDDFKIENLYVETKRIDSVAHMTLHFSANISVDSFERNTLLFVRREGDASRIVPVRSFLLRLQKGRSDHTIDFNIQNPALWWPNEQGEQAMYELLWLDAKSKKQAYLGSLGHCNFGVRSVALVQQADSTQKGSSFYFVVNGKPIYMKGANYVPMDVFPARVRHEDRRKLLLAAKEAHMNMIRIWGGGIYESEDFYSLCDSLGIMVWQDFMYACAMYPKMMKRPNLSYVDVFHSEDEYEWHDNFVRIEKHPCLALWCGNNEVEEGWWNWGWQRSLNYSARDSAAVWQAYQERFQEAIPSFLAAQQSMVPYVSSSPQIGWGHAESLTQGDSHYWGVWWGMQPYETYAQKVPRFASEFGMQSWPCYSSMQKCLPDSARTLLNKAFVFHQKHPTGQANLDGYLKRYQLSYGTFKDYLMATQILQADAMKTALEAQRKASPRCMGSLMWQLNDCWPGASWSLIDYYGEKKKAYYRAQECFVKKYQTPPR